MTNEQLVAHVEFLEAELAKAKAFKKWVHDYLDNIGVPHDPNPERTKATECRISGRMDWLITHDVTKQFEAAV